MNKKKVLWIVIPIAAAVLAVVAILINLLSRNRYEITLNIPDEDEVHLEYGEQWICPEITAVYDGTILHFTKAEVEPVIANNVDLSKVGAYEVRILVSHKEVTKEAVIRVYVEDHVAPQLTLIGETTQIRSPLEPYEEEGYEASDNVDGDLTDAVTVEEKDGIYTYLVTDASGNETTVTRTILYKDQVPPTITLEGEAVLTMNAGADYVEPGYTASDDCDGDISDRVKIVSNVDVNVLGTYEVVYTVQDAAGNEAQEIRQVVVKDEQAPSLGLYGNYTMYVKLGEGFSDPGAYANDAVDGDLSSQVIVSGGVDASAIGVYTISYSVADGSGNKAYASRKVYVYQPQSAYTPVNPGSKIVYLTFDDGPGPYTTQLLDLLDQYGIKVTFFVTNRMPEYTDLITEEYNRGHEIALHSYVHAYHMVYQSEETYYDDLQKISDLVYEKTGTRRRIIRFPGGSSNASSKNYNTGLMTRLTKDVTEMGYLYFDWNVSSGDGNGSISRQAVIDNVIKGISSHDMSVVLQHDPIKNSVDAVEEIIVWGLANGYTFLPITEDTPVVQHGQLNN